MRTMKVLIAGWLAGGAIIVLMSLAPKTAVAAKPGDGYVPAERRVSSPPVAAANVGGLSGRRSTGPIVPVAGIRPADLHDNFTQPRGNGRLHDALDIMAPRGTPVVAAVDGTIRKLFNSRAGGLTIYEFDQAEEKVYYYAHLDRYADGVAEGLVVAQGTVIGYVGTTGNAPPGAPHLHFAVEVLPPTKEWWKGTPVNPYVLLTSR